MQDTSAEALGRDFTKGGMDMSVDHVHQDLRPGGVKGLGFRVWGLGFKN